MSRKIHGLGPAPPKENKKAADKKTEEFNVGGGQQVVRPTHGTGRTPLVDDLIASAQERSQSPDDRPNIGDIIIYSNGFQIGTQEFRSLEEGPNVEQNKLFLAALKKGEVPLELDSEIVAEYGPEVEEVGITIVNRSSEAYSPPKEKFSFAKSQGQSLGSTSTGQTEAFSNAKAVKLEPSTAPGSCTIQIILADRTKHRLAVSPSTTVFSIYQHVMALSGLPATFQLIAGFPPVTLVDPSATVESAKLKNASVTQQL